MNSVVAGRAGDEHSNVRPTPPVRLQRPWRTVPVSLVLAAASPLLILLAVLTVLGIGLFGALESTRTLLRERGEATLEKVVDRLLGRIDPLPLQLTELAQAFEQGRLNLADPAAARGFIDGALSATPQVAGFAWVRPDLTITAFGRDANTMAFENWVRRDDIRRDALDWARTATGVRWVPPRWSPILQRPVIELEVPLHRNGQFEGLLVSQLGLDDLERFLDALAPQRGQMPFILYGRDQLVANAAMNGHRHAHPDRTQGLMQVATAGDPLLAHIWDQDATIVLAPTADNPVGVHRIIGPDGPVTFVYRIMDAGTEQPWYVGVHYAGTLAEAEVARLKLIGAVGAGVLVLSLMVAFVIARSLRRPVLALAIAARELEGPALDAVGLVSRSRITELDHAATAFNAMIDGLRERERIRDLFGKYVPRSVAERLLSHPGTIRLGGERREVTLLFTDVADFTTLSEQLPPEQVVRLLNAYFQGITVIVGDEGGVIVDFIGDAVFAIFGAPLDMADHALRALSAARRIAEFSDGFTAAAQRNGGYQFGRTRVGVHTGIATVGNVGSSDRLKYSATGDVVNTASRLEGANKMFGSRILASGAVIAAAGWTGARPIGQLVLKGRLTPLLTEEVFVDAAPDWLPDYLAAYALLDAGDPAAGPAFVALAVRCPDDAVIAGHVARIAAGQVSSVITLSEK